MTLIQLLTWILLATTVVRIFKFMRSPRGGSRYHDMILMLLWAFIPGTYIVMR